VVGGRSRQHLAGVFCFVAGLSPVSLLQSALTDKHLVLPVFSRKPPHSSSLDATLTRMPISVASKGFTGTISPLNATLAKARGMRRAIARKRSPARAMRVSILRPELRSCR
jgi:hypothetical protein